MADMTLMMADIRLEIVDMKLMMAGMRLEMVDIGLERVNMRFIITGIVTMAISTNNIWQR